MATRRISLDGIHRDGQVSLVVHVYNPPGPDAALADPLVLVVRFEAPSQLCNKHLLRACLDELYLEL